MFGFVLVGFFGFVFSYPILDSGIEGFLNEDQEPVYTYNFSQNVTGSIQGNVTFSIYDIVSSNSLHSGFEIEDFYWIFINSSTGIMTLNSTNDNETSYFNISIQVVDDSSQGTTVASFFTVNATNDAPNFTNINSTYNLTQSDFFSRYLNATDEEEHYPLNFTIIFNETCTHASWSGRNANENCSLFDLGFDLINSSNTSALMNFTPSRNDVGVYYANISVMDSGENYDCPHIYCDNSTYEQNKTFYYSEIVVFNIKANLEINASDCQNKIFNESAEGTCEINITTINSGDSLNISSNALLRNYDDSYILNNSWFHANESTTASNFVKTITINVTPTKNEIGNWSINFSAIDGNLNQDSELVYIQVNRNASLDDVPNLDALSNQEMSINENKRFNFSVYDNDFLIPDKNQSYGGYSETTTFHVNITNKSNGVPMTITGFATSNIVIEYMPSISGGKLTNHTTAYAQFTALESEVGEYFINITAQDQANQNHSQTFDLTILNNSFPYWNVPLETNFTINENETLALNLSQNVSDNDEDSLTFTYELLNGESFASFSVSSVGIINFTANDSDVGSHLVNIIVSDGYLTNTTTFNFTINNLNDNVSIYSLLGGSTNINNGTVFNLTEDSASVFTLTVEDYDLEIPDEQIDKGFYNETFTLNLTILNATGQEVDLFNFTENRDLSYISSQTRFEASFTPNKSHVGNYTVIINITDLGNSSDEFIFNLSISDINHAPVLESLENQSSFINDSFYYDINSTDVEDIDESTGNLTYSYEFLNDGNTNDFISNNESIFNTTTGIFNITFNDTQDGAYHLNITVNDSENFIDYEDFWVYVYGFPTINFPLSSQSFSLKENETTEITFQVNHSVGDNLTYLFYIENNGTLDLKDSINYYGNSTNYTWSFTPNFTDETYSENKNLTLVVYSSNTNFTNASDFNTTSRWNITINHTNSPVSFEGIIGGNDYTLSGGSPQTVTLSDYFSDYDASDLRINQSVRFTYNTYNASGNVITVTVTDWTNGTTPSINFSSTANGQAMYNIVANEYNESNDSQIINTQSSNNFTVDLILTTTTTTITTTRTKNVPVSLKLIMPDPVSAYKKDRIVLPIELYNDGGQDLSGINLSGLIAKDNFLREDFNLSFSESYIQLLKIGERKNVTMTIDIDTDSLGLYEVTVNASVRDPVYADWGKFYLTIEENEQVKEKLLFTEEFILQNPECVELSEIVNEAKEYFQQGDFVKSILKINQAIEACKEAIAQPSKSKSTEITENKLYFYILVGTLVVFFTGVGYYFYKRMKLKRRSLQFELNEKT